MQYLEIELKSDLCAENGESAGNAIDSDICMDDAGLPYIPARRIKGCLKQAAFDLNKMGYLTASEDNIKKLFGDAYGNEGIFFIRDAVINDAEGIRRYLKSGIEKDDNIKDMLHASKVVNLFTSVRGQTRLKDGVKVDNSLRFTRVVNQYDPLSINGAERLKFYAPIYIDTEDEELCGLFNACCKAARHIGHSRNRGLGNVLITLCHDDVYQDNTRHIEIDDKSSADDFKTDEMLKISYKVVLNSPLTLPGCDELNTSVPARSVIGCVAGSYIRSGSAQDEAFRRLFLDGTVCWSDMTPVIDGDISTPVPMMLVKLKNNGNKLINNLREKDDKWKQEKPKTLDGSFAVKTNSGYKIAEPAIHTRYHYALNGNRMNKAMLYMQESIDAGSIYGGTVICPANMKDTVIKCLSECRFRFGRSKNAQYASCSLHGKIKVDKYSQDMRHVKSGEKIYVVLQSDLVLLVDGAYRTDSESVRNAIAYKLGISSDIPNNSRDYCRYHVIGGYQSKWQLQKPQIPVVRAGSVYCFEAGETEIPQSLRIGELAQEGMGLCSVMTMTDMESASDIEMSRIEQADFMVSDQRLAQLMNCLEIEVIMENMRKMALEYDTKGNDIPEARLRKMLAQAKDYNDLLSMINKIKESDKSSEKTVSRKKAAEKFVNDIKKAWEEQLRPYETRADKNMINRISAKWKEPLDIVLHKYHYQKEKRG